MQRLGLWRLRRLPYTSRLWNFLSLCFLTQAVEGDEAASLPLVRIRDHVGNTVNGRCEYVTGHHVMLLFSFFLPKRRKENDHGGEDGSCPGVWLWAHLVFICIGKLFLPNKYLLQITPSFPFQCKSRLKPFGTPGDSACSPCSSFCSPTPTPWPLSTRLKAPPHNFRGTWHTV